MALHGPHTPHHIWHCTAHTLPHHIWHCTTHTLPITLGIARPRHSTSHLALHSPHTPHHTWHCTTHTLPITFGIARPTHSPSHLALHGPHTPPSHLALHDPHTPYHTWHCTTQTLHITFGTAQPTHSTSHLALHDPHTPHLAMHDPHTPHLALHGPHTPHLALHGPHTPHLALHGPHTPHLALHDPHTPHLALHGPDIHLSQPGPVTATKACVPQVGQNVSVCEANSIMTENRPVPTLRYIDACDVRQQQLQDKQNLGKYTHGDLQLYRGTCRGVHFSWSLLATTASDFFNLWHWLPHSDVSHPVGLAAVKIDVNM